MDKVVDHIFEYQGNGVIKDFPGNYTQLREKQMETEQKTAISRTIKPQASGNIAGNSGIRGKKSGMSFKEKQEFSEKEFTKDVIEECQENNTPLLILSRGMAQRSYSIGEITSLYLCYDEGDAGATTQKISRALTPSDVNKVGRIFSLSFDPNRDDKFDTMMIAAAQNYAKRKSVEVDEALRRVIGTIDIFGCSENGRIDIQHDTYLQQILDRNSLSRMVGKQANINELSYDEVLLVAQGNASYSTLNKTTKADKGKIGEKKTSIKRSTMSKEDLKLFDKARKVLATIVEHLPYLAIMTNSESIRSSLVKCTEVPDYAEYVTQEFGVTPNTILEFFDRGVLNYDLASLQKSAKVVQLGVA
jgi:hypothetical protein